MKKLRMSLRSGEEESHRAYKKWEKNDYKT
jgi:hypothetical protein